MNRLQEKRSLVELARKFGQEPAAELLAEIAALERDEEQQLKREAAIRERIAEDLLELFNLEVKNELVQSPPTEIQEQGETNARPITTSEPNAPSPAATAPTIAERVARVISESGVVAPDPVLARPQKDLAQEIKYLREWVSRIAATGPGGGAAEIYNLDLPVKSVTGDYTLGRKDYYVGVSSMVKTYITLPLLGSNVKEGRVVVIKDESGHAQLTPIKIVGTIDNDINGAEIRINNGAVQLVYHNGCWRII
jgi:hypothetical protein